MNKQPHEQDAAWLKQGFIFNHGVEPMEAKINAFIEKVAIFCAEGHDELTARKMAFKLVDI